MKKREEKAKVLRIPMVGEREWNDSGERIRCGFEQCQRCWARAAAPSPIKLLASIDAPMFGLGNTGHAKVQWAGKARTLESYM